MSSVSTRLFSCQDNVINLLRVLPHHRRRDAQNGSSDWMSRACFVSCCGAPWSRLIQSTTFVIVYSRAERGSSQGEPSTTMGLLWRQQVHGCILMWSCCSHNWLCLISSVNERAKSGSLLFSTKDCPSAF